MSEKKGKPKHLRPQYSGSQSIEFWRQVNALKGHRDEAYSCGCLLQDMEATVLRWLSNHQELEKLG